MIRVRQLGVLLDMYSFMLTTFLVRLTFPILHLFVDALKKEWEITQSRSACHQSSVGLADRSVPQGDGSCRHGGSEVASAAVRIGWNAFREAMRIWGITDSEGLSIWLCSWVPKEPFWKSHRRQSPGVHSAAKELFLRRLTSLPQTTGQNKQ